MIRIGVIADTHIPDRASAIPQKILDDFKNVNMVIHLGDIVEFSVLEQLKAVCGNVEAVWGNMDSLEVKEKLPERVIIKVGKYKIGITHGFGHPKKLVNLVARKFKKDELDIILFGHSHLPFNEQRDGILFFNPGSATDKIFSPFNSYGIIEIDDKIKAQIIKI